MKKFTFVSFMLAVLLLSGCGTTDNTNSKSDGYDVEKSHSKLDEYEVVNTESEVQDGDFIYRLVTEKSEYTTDESVNIYAELEYVGDQKEVMIYHAMSPFYFPMVEKVRNYEIEYAMAEPLVGTTLKKGEPLRHDYTRAGGYSTDKQDDYTKFMKSFVEDGFLEGYYILNGSAEFYTGDLEGDQGDRKDYNMEGKIDFKVFEASDGASQ
ncbi:hypothetical protein [Cytobacillus gottheilii]|uniref:Lipoprotein n=1 Tax=Cytobacillus gottheilii TaxID=859144 RepID=A0ABX8FCN2_9BACI|nr:hypothetical protein [Cytobacillus gottheilii]QVY61307.1 hypothetical protein J1899_20560 [Cytobacillus gottheilii]